MQPKMSLSLKVHIIKRLSKPKYRGTVDYIHQYRDTFASMMFQNNFN